LIINNNTFENPGQLYFSKTYNTDYVHFLTYPARQYFCARSAAPTPAAERPVPLKVPGIARRELAFGKGFSSLRSEGRFHCLEHV